MKIKKNDKVKVLRGKDKGKQGKIIEVDGKRERVTVEGVNLSWRHVRPRKGGEKGQKIQFPASLPFSAVASICPKCNQTTRVGFKVIGSKKIRICKKCGEIIE